MGPGEQALWLYPHSLLTYFRLCCFLLHVCGSDRALNNLTHDISTPCSNMVRNELKCVGAHMSLTLFIIIGGTGNASLRVKRKLI